jgi:hypothetical protein
MLSCGCVRWVQLLVLQRGSGAAGGPLSPAIKQLQVTEGVVSHQLHVYQQWHMFTVASRQATPWQGPWVVERVLAVAACAAWHGDHWQCCHPLEWQV